jgi:hypothetical protein
MGNEDEARKGPIFLNNGGIIYIEDDEISSPSTLHLPGTSKPFQSFQKAIRRWQVLKREDREVAWISIDKSQHRFRSWEIASIVIRSTNKPLLPKDEEDS